MPVVAGVLTDFGSARNLRVQGVGPLIGIDTTGMGNGTRLSLSFVNGLTITANGSPSFGAKILIDHTGTASLVCPADSVVDFVLMTDSGAFAFWMYAGGSLATDGGAGTSTTTIIPLFADTYPSLETSPTVAAQAIGDFDNLPTGSIPVELNAWAQADVGYTGTIAVMIGGTKDNPDGTTAATMTYAGTGSYTQILLQASITNPGGKLPVKLVLSSSDAAHVLLVQGLSLVIGTGSAGAGGGGGGANPAMVRYLSMLLG